MAGSWLDLSLDSYLSMSTLDDWPISLVFALIVDLDRPFRTLFERSQDITAKFLA
ncbi:MAG: hypothetical protein WBG04_09585 [Haloferula sp.]